jgi:hypothetical protein
MKPPSRLFPLAVLGLACLGGSRPLLAQVHNPVPPPPFELRQDQTAYNLQSPGGMPLSSSPGDPPGSNGRAPTPEQQRADGLTELPATPRQFQGQIVFGALAVPRNHNLNPSLSYAANAAAANLDLPRGEVGGQVTVVMTRALVGAPWLSRSISFLFGSPIPPPLLDVDGNTLPAGTLPHDYWAPEPHRPGRLAAHEILSLANLAARLDAAADPVAAFVKAQLSEETRSLLPTPGHPDLREKLLNGLNDLIAGPSIYTLERFSNVALSLETQILDPAGTSDTRPARLNRLLLEDAFPDLLARTAVNFYWSPHARTAYAIQPGPVDVVWRKATPVTTPPADYATNPGRYWVDAGNYYTLYRARYVVSGSAVKPPRKIYWTEGVFRPTGKPVVVPAGRVAVVNVVFNNNFPRRVEMAYRALGQTPVVEDPNAQLEETRTLWYESPRREILAYNVEGRVFVELLGETEAGGRTRRPLGFEIVDVVREPNPADVTIELGEALTAYAPEDQADDTGLYPEPVSGSENFIFQQFLSGAPRPLVYATRETRNRNDVQVHWLETGLEGLRWPFRFVRYRQVWPADVAKYSHYLRPLVATENEAKATAVQLPAENAPVIDYQDPLDQPRAKITETFAFYTFLTEQFPAHRTLLRFRSGEEIRFERVFSWLDAALRHPNLALPSFASDFSAPPTGAATFGDARISGGLLRLTDATAGQTGSLVIHDFAGGEPVRNFRASFRVSLRDGTPDPADGFSFNFGTVLDDMFGEEGIANGLVVSFDTWDDDSGDRAPGITVKYNGTPLATVALAEARNPNPEPLGTLPPPTDPNTGLPMTLATGADFAPVEILLSDDGKLDVSYKGVRVLADVATSYTPRAGRFGLGARTHDAFSAHWVDDLVIVVNEDPGAGLPSFASSEPANQLSSWVLGRTFHWPDPAGRPRVEARVAYVGERLEAPAGELGAGGSDYWAGYIRQSEGNAFHPEAYRDPFVVGFETANRGAILSVNVIPGNDRLEVWWFRGNALPSFRLAQGFKPIYWPAVIGRYTLAWPPDPREIVLASNDGSGPLMSLEAKGRIYYQNDRTLPGFNPNEEHALMQGGQAYALRDDLNILSGNNFTSEPYVLLDYMAADDRPAMTVFKVRRERPETGDTFDYTVQAGTILQPPMPLPLLDLPLAPKIIGTPPRSLNREVRAWQVADTVVATSEGVRWVTLATDTPHGVGRTRTMHLQNPDNLVQAARVFVTGVDYTAQTLTGVILDRDLATLSPWMGTQPGEFARRRYGVSATAGLTTGRAVVAADTFTRRSWKVEVMGTGTEGGQSYVDLQFSGSETYDAGAAANLLAVPSEVAFDDQFNNWRLGYEPLPVNVTDLTLREQYAAFTLQDRKGNLWVYRGPHDAGEQPTLAMRFYYKTLPGFFFPTLPLNAQPPVGTITPYLRAKNNNGTFAGDPVYGNRLDPQAGDDNALVIHYSPVWPPNTPVLQMAETLTLPKRGLPAVRSQTSLQVVYQQSQVTRNDAGESVVLHDPTAEKMFELGPPDRPGRLGRIPDSVRTQSYRGMTFFPNLPPHLSERFFLDPNRGAHGALIFKGEFRDEPTGDDFLLLNVLGASDRAYLKNLCLPDDPARDDWEAAVDGLTADLWLFVENPARPGTYYPRDLVQYGPAELIRVNDDDQAVDSYALTAVGPGTGYVTLIAGNGLAFTPPAEPVSVHIIRVVDTLYRGELKIVASSNPLSETLTLQQVVDLAGRSEDYNFEWKIAAPVDGLPPDVYLTTAVELLADGVWQHLPFPLATDRAAGVAGADAGRLMADVLTSVAPRQRVPFTGVSRDGSQFRLNLAPGPRLLTGTRLVLRDAEGHEVRASVNSLSTETLLVVDVEAGQPALPDPFTPFEVYEQAVEGQPQSIVFRTFTVPADAAYNEQWLSLNLDGALGAKVYFDGQFLVQANLGDGDTPASSPPGIFNPLPRAWRLDGAALAGGIPVAGGLVQHTVAVELFAPSVPDQRLAFNLRLEASETVDVTDAGWVPLDASRYPDGVRALLGGQADVRALSDNYLIMRYQAKNPSHASFRPAPGDPNRNLAWSVWTRPQLAEGWIKRVLAGINPFNQRVADLFANQVNTDVSIIQQAGPRWEGDVALNLDSLNQFGLIEIYETVLRRGRMLSIDAGINYGPANDALLLAAGYLSDLYMMLANEAWADAANPTIGIGTKDRTYGEIATALFAFRGQLPNLLEEELALLRGRDDFLMPGVEIRPVYNRLYWNYTRGIDAGEVIYTLNYDILDLDENGRADADDARRLYPQGHGDAYGHYLTALKGYYSLFMNSDFDWVPRIEAVVVLGQPVSVDYQDERKFAAAAAALARAGQQITDLSWRRDYRSGQGLGWKHLAEERVNSRRTVPTTRQWGVDHWGTRIGQGAYLHWVVGNAILPDRDPDPSHEGGIQQVDRTTVVELLELPALAGSLQTTLDNAEAGLNPLGLPDTAVPFDINPNLVVGGTPQTHFEQVFERARTALRNALAAFDDAKDVTRLMRSEQDSLADFRTMVNRQELAYTNQLIELYGTPYPDDIGPGRTYRTGYTGPDLVHYMYVDLAELSTSLLDPASDSEWRIDTQTFVANWVDAASGISDFNFITKARVNGIDLGLDPNPWAPNYNANHYVTFVLPAHGFFGKPATWRSRRLSPGRIQQAISDIIKARNAAYLALYNIDAAKGDLDWALKAFERQKDSHEKVRNWKRDILIAEQVLEGVKAAVEIVDKILDETSEQVNIVANAASESLPTVFIAGLASGGDLTAPARATLKQAGVTFKSAVNWKKVATFAAIKVLETANEAQKRWVEFDLIENEEWNQTLRDATSTLRDKVYGVQNLLPVLNARLQELDDAQRKYRTLLAEGDRIQEERRIFRQRAAAVVQGYRTRDAAFRIFRNEKLERYKALYDLAARYTFMAAQAFDYETGLLHTDQGRRFLARAVQSRALGVLRNGEPQFAGSNTGDPGLSSVLAEMQADWQVLKGRLGFNNPDAYGTTVSLRQEFLRLLPGAEGDQQWKDYLYARRMAHVLDDPDVRRYCLQIDPGNGQTAPGLVLEFSTTIADGLNLFGRPLAGGDHAFSPSAFATKIHAVGVVLEGYRGMDSPGVNQGAVGFGGGVSPADPAVPFLDPLALAATPYVYLVPVGVDSMRSPPLGDQSVVRTWSVDDVAIPLPFNIGASDFSTFPFWQSADSLSEPLFAVRKHQAFRPVAAANLFPADIYGINGQLQPSQFTNRRLVGRSLWNSRWKLVIPGRTLLHDPNEGLDRFIQTVRDVKLRFVTYSYAGN